MHCDLISMIFAYYLKPNFSRKSQTMSFCKRCYPPISRYLYTEAKKRGGEISLHKHFKEVPCLDYIKYSRWQRKMAEKTFQINLESSERNKHEDAIIITFPRVLNILSHIGLIFAP